MLAAINWLEWRVAAEKAEAENEALKKQLKIIRLMLYQTLSEWKREKNKNEKMSQV